MSWRKNQTQVKTKYSRFKEKTFFFIFTFWRQIKMLLLTLRFKSAG